MLDRLYSRFDSLVREFGVFKLETIGDCYMVAGGVAREQPRTHAARVAAFALAAIDELLARRLAKKKSRQFDEADELQEELYQKHGVSVDDRERVWWLA